MIACQTWTLVIGWLCIKLGYSWWVPVQSAPSHLTCQFRALLTTWSVSLLVLRDNIKGTVVTIDFANLRRVLPLPATSASDPVGLTATWRCQHPLVRTPWSRATPTTRRKSCRTEHTSQRRPYDLLQTVHAASRTSGKCSSILC